MKHRTPFTGRDRCSIMVLASLMLVMPLRSTRAADVLSAPPEEEEQVYSWFVRAGARALFGVKASVTRTPTTVTSGVYDDGFVLPDAGGGASGKTWNWGYQASDQISGDQLWMSRLTDVPMAGLFQDKANDPSLGGEVIAGAELLRFNVGKKEVSMGFEVGYGYTSFSVSDTSTARGTARLTAAAYNLNGIVPPLPPYAGTYGDPGPRIDLNPSVTGVIDSPAEATFEGDLDSSIHVVKLGLWLNYPLSRKLNLGLSVGYASMYADTQLKFTESVSFENPGIAALEPTDKVVGGRKWHPGAYAQLRLEYGFTPRLGAYLGGDFQYNKPLEFSGAGRDVKLDFGGTFAGSLGLIFRW